MKRWSVTVAVSVLTMLVLAGCNRGGCGRQPTGDVPEVSALDELRIEIVDLKVEAGAEAAIARMQVLLQDPEQKAYKAEILGWLLDEYQETGSVAAMQSTYLELAEDPEIAELGFQRVMRAGGSTNRAKNVAWYETILDASVPSSIKAATWRYRINAYVEQGAVAPVAERLDEILALSAPADSVGVLSYAINAGRQIDDASGMAAIISAIRTSAPEREDLARLCLATEADSMIHEGALAEARTFLREHADTLGDQGVSRRWAVLLKKAAKQNKDALVAEIATYALKHGEHRPRTRRAVATQWVQQAVDAKNAKQFVDRMTRGLDGGCAVKALFSPLRDAFYALMRSGGKAVQEDLIALAERCLEAPDLTEGMRQSLSLLLLDGAFFAENFKYALGVIGEGVAGFDEAWHAEMTDKLGAHLALQEERFEDAIALFRKHMQRVEVWDAPVVNPENSIKVSKESVLGFNEKRIGDIYTQMADHVEDAKEAYTRAREWYQKAIEVAEPGSPEAKAAEKELAAVPTLDEPPPSPEMPVP